MLLDPATYYHYTNLGILTMGKPWHTWLKITAQISSSESREAEHHPNLRRSKRSFVAREVAIFCQKAI